jgi:hypothetical protein
MSSRLGARPAPFGWSLPNEHGFWTMLGASLLGALLRTGIGWTSVAAAEAVLVVTLLLAGALHRRMRAQGPVQLAAIAALALSGAAVELIAGLPIGTVVAGAFARIAIFFACALLVRAAFARSSSRGRRRGLKLDLLAVSLPLAAGGALAVAGFAPESRACLLAGMVAIPIALGRATAKQLKPLGIALAVITLASALVLAL